MKIDKKTVINIAIAIGAIAAAVVFVLTIWKAVLTVLPPLLAVGVIYLLWLGWKKNNRPDIIDERIKAINDKKERVDILTTIQGG